MFTFELILGGAFFLLFIIFSAVIMAMKFFRKVEQGKAMIVNTMKSRPLVTFTGRIVLPVIHKAEVMDISLKRIVINRSSHEGLICKDNIRADISVNFFVRVNPTEDDVLRVASNIGCERASDQETLDGLFGAKFAEALKTVGKQMEFEQLYEEREIFRDSIKQMIADDLGGYRLEDVAIDHLEQTPIESLDNQNILDAQGIRKITELTAEQRVAANNAIRDEEKRIKKQDVEAKEAILALERQQADAEAKQKREIETTVARETAATQQVVEEERLKSEEARIRAEQEIQVKEEAKKREIEVAEQERLRVVAIKEEEVIRARELEIVARQQEVEVSTIQKEKVVEDEKRAIAEVIRERVAVEKTVAQEEERIKEVREVSEADRLKQVKVIAAQAQAEEELVKEIKQAEAQEKSARHQAQTKVVLAEAEMEAANKNSEAMKTLAEGTQAEEAAKGLAQVRVREAQAVANEKYGIAEAKVQKEKLLAVAKGEEEKGLAEARVKQEQLLAIAKGEEEKGLAEARVKHEKHVAEAHGIKVTGLAEVDVKREDADAIQILGKARAQELRDKYAAESEGLRAKFEAMSGVEDNAREHEELRLRLEKAETLEAQAIEANRQVAEVQADVLAEAFKQADIDIVGGDGAFFDRIINSVGTGKSIDAVINNSEIVASAAQDYVAGDKDLAGDIKDILTGMSTQDLQNLSIAGALQKLAAHSTGDDAAKLNMLMEKAKDLGLK